MCAANGAQDYSVSYFVSGAGDMAAYADDCLFADPFVGFRGEAPLREVIQHQDL